MSVLAVTAIAVRTTTTTNTVRSADSGGTTGGGPSSPGSSPSSALRRTSAPVAVPLPTTTEHIGAAGLIASIRALIDSPVPFIPPAVAPLAVGAAAASAPLSTLRPVVAPTDAPAAGAGSADTAALRIRMAAVGATDPAAALRLAHALDASGNGASAERREDDPRSNAAVLRLDAAADWSRHQQERAELLADLRTASVGLHVHHGADAG